MKSFLEKPEFTLHDINLLIQNEAEEGIYLEFKGADAFIPIPEKDEAIICRSLVISNKRHFSRKSGFCLLK